jgi:hypothetical protein
VHKRLASESEERENAAENGIEQMFQDFQSEAGTDPNKINLVRIGMSMLDSLSHPTGDVYATKNNEPIISIPSTFVSKARFMRHFVNEFYSKPLPMDHYYFGNVHQTPLKQLYDRTQIKVSHMLHNADILNSSLHPQMRAMQKAKHAEAILSRLFTVMTGMANLIDSMKTNEIGSNLSSGLGIVKEISKDISTSLGKFVAEDGAEKSDSLMLLLEAISQFADKGVITKEMAMRLASEHQRMNPGDEPLPVPLTPGPSSPVNGVSSGTEASSPEPKKTRKPRKKTASSDGTTTSTGTKRAAEDEEQQSQENGTGKARRGKKPKNAHLPASIDTTTTKSANSAPTPPQSTSSSSPAGLYTTYYNSTAPALQANGKAPITMPVYVERTYSDYQQPDPTQPNEGLLGDFATDDEDE